MVPPIDRAAAFAETPERIPRRFVYWLIAGAAVLSLGGLAAEHLFSSSGLNPTATTTPTTQAPVTTTTTPSSNEARQVTSSLSSFMGITPLPPTPAPTSSLIDQNGATVPSIPQAGRVVVLSFFNGTCNDICPILAAELQQADADLGTKAAEVDFLTVNTDPRSLAPSGQSAVLSDTQLGSLGNWRILTGPLATMDSLWKAYGVTITVADKSGVEVHNDLLYFIDQNGDLRYRATPFANESRNGTWSLPPASIARFAQGIASYAGGLVNP